MESTDDENNVSRVHSRHSKCFNIPYCLPCKGKKPIRKENQNDDYNRNGAIDSIGDEASQAGVMDDLGSLSLTTETEMVLSALICSHAVYSNNISELEKCFLEWFELNPQCNILIESFQKIYISLSSNDIAIPFLAAYTENSVYIAFRGTCDCKILLDIMSNVFSMDAFSALTNSQVQLGTIKVTFFDEIPISTILNSLDNKPRRRIVFCGHSVGGSIAHATLFKYIMRIGVPSQTLNRRLIKNLISVAFGAPLFCDEATARYIREEGLSRKFVTFVNQDDPIPGLLEYSPILISSVDKEKVTRFSSSQPLLSLVAPWLNLLNGDAVPNISSSLSSQIRKKRGTLHRSLSFTERNPASEVRFQLFAPAGLFFRLTDVVKVEEILSSGCLYSEMCTQTLKHHALLGGEGYKEKIINLLLQPAMSRMPSWNDRSQSAFRAEYFTAFPRRVFCFPHPKIEEATYDFEPDSSCINIRIVGENLFFLTHKPEILIKKLNSGREQEEGQSEEYHPSPPERHHVVKYSDRGDCIQILLEDGRDFSNVTSKIFIRTSFGNAESPIIPFFKDRNLSISCNMWQQSIQILSITKSHLKHQPVKLQWIGRVLSILTSLIELNDMGVALALKEIEDDKNTFMNEAEAPESKGEAWETEGHLNLEEAETFFDYLSPLMESLFPALGKFWSVEFRSPVQDVLPLASPLVQLSGNSMSTVEGGLGSTGVIPSGIKHASFLQKQQTRNGYGEFERRAIPNVLLTTSRSQVVDLLLDYMGLPISDKTFRNISESDKETEVVETAIQHNLQFMEDMDMGDTIDTLMKLYPESKIAKYGTNRTKFEAVKRIHLLLGVYRLYTLLSLHKHTFLAFVYFKDEDKDEEMDALMSRLSSYWFKKSLAKESNAENESAMNRSMAAESSDMQRDNSSKEEDRILLVKFPVGLRADREDVCANTERRLQKFKCFAHCGVIFVSNKKYLSSEMINRLKSILPVGRTLLIFSVKKLEFTDSLNTAKIRDSFATRLGFNVEDVFFSFVNPTSEANEKAKNDDLKRKAEKFKRIMQSGCLLELEDLAILLQNISYF